jgi:hypothetical protein
VHPVVVWVLTHAELGDRVHSALAIERLLAPLRNNQIDRPRSLDVVDIDDSRAELGVHRAAGSLGQGGRLELDPEADV